MKKIIYISGVTGGILLILSILGIFVEFSFNRHMLLSGLLLTVISITFSLIYKYLQNQKIRNLLRKYKEGGSSDLGIRKSENLVQKSEGRKEQGKGIMLNDEKRLNQGQKALNLARPL
jgi:hypothetical protein